MEETTEETDEAQHTHTHTVLDLNYIVFFSLSDKTQLEKRPLEGAKSLL